MLSSRWFQTFTAAKEDRDWKEGRKSFPEKKNTELLTNVDFDVKK